VTIDVPMPRSFAEVLFGGSPATAAGAGILIAIALIAVFARSSRRMIRTFKPRLRDEAADVAGERRTKPIAIECSTTADPQRIDATCFDFKMLGITSGAMLYPPR
jgi:hypothetical protein